MAETLLLGQGYMSLLPGGSGVNQDLSGEEGEQPPGAQSSYQT